MKNYSLFYSWQSDKPEARAIITKVLKRVQTQLLEENIELIIDQDTRERIGTEDIAATVLKKIKECDVFLGDITPVITLSNKSGEIKRMPNSNVMYEYGFAKGVKGSHRVILVAFLSEGEKISQLPFDINHDTITHFNNESGLQYLLLGIKRVLKQVDADRENLTPSFDCKLLFNSLTNEIIIQPLYRREFFGFKNHEEVILEKEIPFKVMSFKNGHFSGKPFNSRGALVQPISKEVNKSISPLSLTFFNTGSEALENSKLVIRSTDSRIQFLDSDTEHYMFPHVQSIYDPMDIVDKCVTIELKDVNPGDCQVLDPFYIFVPYEIEKLTLLWEFSSKRFRKTGELAIGVEKQYKDYFYPDKEQKEVIVSEYLSRK